jgi:hypothetical protein
MVKEVEDEEVSKDDKVYIGTGVPYKYGSQAQ